MLLYYTLAHRYATSALPSGKLQRKTQRLQCTNNDDTSAGRVYQVNIMLCRVYQLKRDVRIRIR